MYKFTHVNPLIIASIKKKTFFYGEEIQFNLSYNIQCCITIFYIKHNNILLMMKYKYTIIFKNI